MFIEASFNLSVLGQRGSQSRKLMANMRLPFGMRALHAADVVGYKRGQNNSSNTTFRSGIFQRVRNLGTHWARD